MRAILQTESKSPSTSQIGFFIYSEDVTCVCANALCHNYGGLNLANQKRRKLLVFDRTLGECHSPYILLSYLMLALGEMK